MFFVSPLIAGSEELNDIDSLDGGFPSATRHNNNNNGHGHGHHGGGRDHREHGGHRGHHKSSSPRNVPPPPLPSASAEAVDSPAEGRKASAGLRARSSASPVAERPSPPPQQPPPSSSPAIGNGGGASYTKGPGAKNKRHRKLNRETVRCNHHRVCLVGNTV